VYCLSWMSSWTQWAIRVHCNLYILMLLVLLAQRSPRIPRWLMHEEDAEPVPRSRGSEEITWSSGVALTHWSLTVGLEVDRALSSSFLYSHNCVFPQPLRFVTPCYKRSENDIDDMDALSEELANDWRIDVVDWRGRLCAWGEEVGWIKWYVQDADHFVREITHDN
jgi:hypothetical protein